MSSHGRSTAKGFTLVELVIVMGLFALLASVAVPITIRVYQNQQLNVAADSIHQALRTALFRTLANVADQNAGIKINATDFTLYRGISYGSRNPSYDEVTSFPSYLIWTGLNEVNFSTHTGVPNATGDITVSDGKRTITFNINQYGRINRP